nr:MAG TPA: hypothetical protein [Caudoviricetes sp.]
MDSGQSTSRSCTQNFEFIDVKFDKNIKFVIK